MATRLPKNYSPSEREPFMNAKQKEFFRRKLNDWRDEIISCLLYTSDAADE